jgi:hypothetical protein
MRAMPVGNDVPTFKVITVSASGRRTIHDFANSADRAEFVRAINLQSSNNDQMRGVS